MFFKRLKELREKREYNQRYIARILGTTQQQYSRYETGIREIPIDMLLKLSNLYETSTDYILEKTNEKKPYPKA